MPPIYWNWYTREDYPRILAVCDDRADFPATYDDWLAKTAKEGNRLISSGKTVHRVEIWSEDLVDFCRQNGIGTIDAQARNQFAMLIIQQNLGPGGVSDKN